MNKLISAFASISLLLAACIAPQPTVETPSNTPELQSTSVIQPATTIPSLPTTTPAPTEAAPTAIPRLAGGQTITLTSLQMIDANIGWGIEQNGHIVHTRDAGSTWQDVTPPQGLYSDKGFFALDATVAWSTPRPSDSCDASQMNWSDYQACMPGPDVPIWRTSDGGKTWQVSRPYEAEDGHYEPIAIHFIDAKMGWFLYVSSYGPMGSTTMGMAKTEDGGLSWMPAVAPGSMCIYRAMIFINAQHGWAGTDCRSTPTVGIPLQDFIGGKGAPELSQTTDGSQSWDYLTLLSPKVLPTGFTSPDADPNISIVCGTTSLERLSPDAFTLHWSCSGEIGTPYFEDFIYQYITSDGGQSWNSWLATGNEFFLNAQTGWRLYSPGEDRVSQFQQTIDSGKTWKTIKSVAWQTAQFDFVDEQTGWAIVTSSDASTLIHTTNGGQTWSEVKPTTVSTISQENVSQLARRDTWPANMIDVLAFSLDWTTIVTLAEDYSGLRLWHMDSRRPYLFIPFKSGDCGLRSTDKVIFSPDGTLLTAGLCNAKVYIWRVTDGALLQKLDGELPDSDAYSLDGSKLVTISSHAVMLWNVSGGMLLQTMPGELVDSAALSPDAAIVAFASHAGLQLWRAADGTPLQSFAAEDFAFGNVAFSPDGTLLASATKQSGLQLWRVADGTLLKSVDPSEYTIALHKLVFSPDGKLLISARYEANRTIVHVWQIPSGALLQTFTGMNPPFSFSPDMSELAMGATNVMQIWGVSGAPAK